MVYQPGGGEGEGGRDEALDNVQVPEFVRFGRGRGGGGKGERQRGVQRGGDFSVLNRLLGIVIEQVLEADVIPETVLVRRFNVAEDDVVPFDARALEILRGLRR